MYKFVYVLTSTEKDLFYEQCYLSVVSLKLHNKDAYTVLLTEKETYESFKAGRNRMLEYFDEVVCEDFGDEYSKKIKSRLLKTSLRNLVDGDLLFIDCDTVIADKLATSELETYELGMVPDSHLHITDSFIKNIFTENAAVVNGHPGYEDIHFNSGVICVKDNETTRKFFLEWNQKYREFLEKRIESDQISLNELNYQWKGYIQEIPGIWNTQVRNGVAYISESRIIHYLSFNRDNKNKTYGFKLPYELCRADIFEKIKETDSVSDEMIEILKNPRKLFHNAYMIEPQSDEYNILFSNHFKMLRVIYSKFRWLFKFNERVLGFIHSFGKRKITR